MEYIVRLGKVILAVLCFFVRIILRVLLSLLLAIHLLSFLVLGPVALILSFVEFITIKPIYYIVTGKKYTDTFNSITDMFCDLMACGKITYRVENEVYCCENDDWYKEKWNNIKNIKVTLYPQKEDEE